MKYLTNNIIGTDIQKWEEVGGFKALAFALKNSDRIIDILKDANLRGMGGAGFPTHIKWKAVFDQVNEDKYVVCNGNEDEPGTFKDRFLLENTPHQIIESMIIACIAVRANNAIVYINPHQVESVLSMKIAISEWKQTSIFSEVENFLGKSLNLQVFQSSGRYIGGEETAVISTIEGGFPFPKIKPPFPFESGIFGKPTLINNTETFAQITHIINNGSQWYLNNKNKLYSLSGDILKPGLYELAPNITLRELIFDIGGGMLNDRVFKAVFTGGPSNTLLTNENLDAKLGFDELKQLGSSLGTGAMIVISEGSSIVRKVSEYVDFFAQGSCGQCPPCKTGTHQLSYLLRKIDTGRANSDDLNAVKSLCNLLPGSGRCGLITGATTVVRSSLEKFHGEYLEQISVV